MQYANIINKIINILISKKGLSLMMKKVVIIGGGYAGIYALRELVKNKNIKITLIDKHTYHNLQPEVYDLIANKSNF